MFCTFRSLVFELLQCCKIDYSLCCCIMVSSATQLPLHCTGNISCAKSNLGFACISQGIPSIFPNANSNTIKFTNTCQGLIYTKPIEWLIDHNYSPFANLPSTGSAVTAAHLSQITTYYKIELRLAPLSTSAAHSNDLCRTNSTCTISNGWCCTMMLFSVAQILQFNNPKPAVPNEPIILYQNQLFEWFTASTTLEIHGVFFTLVESFF